MYKLLSVITAIFAINLSITAFGQTYTTPVVCLHGINSSAASCDTLGDYLSKNHPEQPFYALDVDNNGQSFKNLYEQIADVQELIRGLMQKYPQQFKKGFHFVGHSQGGLLARSVIEESDDFHIKHFVSLAGVQAGEYGNCDTFFGAFDCPALTDLLYSWAMRNLTSVAQFWRDYNYNHYLKGNAFLPYINNEKDPSLHRWKNFVSVDHVYLFASDEDAVIVPWQSSLFGFFGSDGKTIVPMEKQSYYTDDTFGLKTLAESNRLTLTMVPGVEHTSWMHNADIIEKYVAPCLAD